MNAVTIVAGAGIGLWFKHGIPEKYQQTIMYGLGLAVGIIGLQMALKTHNILVDISSLAIGAIIGEAIGIDDKLQLAGQRITGWLGKGHGDVGKGFITATLVFCVGAMAIVGPIQEGLRGDASTLYAKATLDGIAAMVLASGMGMGVAFSAIPVFVFQGSITLLAGIISTMLSEAAMTELTAVGGILIIGVSMLILEIKVCKIANLLPAIPVAAIMASLWTA